jgi:hypothetical protein
MSAYHHFKFIIPALVVVTKGYLLWFLLFNPSFCLLDFKYLHRTYRLPRQNPVLVAFRCSNDNHLPSNIIRQHGSTPLCAQRTTNQMISLRLEEEYDHQQANLPSNVRRHMFRTALSGIGSTLVMGMINIAPGNAVVERAVGGSESQCQQRGNCLETLELDGAIGWTWGGKNRCDASDPKCGIDGKLGDFEAPPVPNLLGNSITHVVEIDFQIGRERERGTLRIGLYGDAHPNLVRPFLDLFDERKGLAITSRLLLDDSLFGAFTSPLYFINGGALTYIYPNQRIEFGVPSQAAAYARSKGRSKAGEGFVPQPRPNKVTDDGAFRPHDCAGLFSIPSSGLGYGGNGLESDDQAYASAFQITASSVPSMDTEGRKVIGQALDNESMALIMRLASIPTNKGIKGVLPGLNYGPPLIKVSIEGMRIRESSTNALA